MALIALWRTSWFLSITLFLGFCLIIYAYYLWHHGRPYMQYSRLIYQGERWFLYDVNGEVHTYDTARIRFDVGLFMQLVLLRETQKRALFLFHDQLTEIQRRQLYLLQLPHFKSKASCVKIDDCD